MVAGGGAVGTQIEFSYDLIGVIVIRPQERKYFGASHGKVSVGGGVGVCDVVTYSTDDSQGTERRVCVSSCPKIQQ